ncbi:hypothetical protein A2662_00395 [Candidatus Giovannonibacteria bacterium RIFCSPHIGHO2_01_FULL_45_33]|uniref:Uncharacterized protein n=1 Tax=Candidatus Giovannonibacteria bacterium RIFCSPLOWO2_01_FULL_45_34 TaxID=1798351 RepID=A0A1F5WYB1_9BACT|nr:MAG: hypothetical protein A2662_00395 [Candidatus Giovannonibacteria bacterium RIFCSPHIGHO2_01_FULL_45_33]OGF70649.1 MAG: hypothetical protein A3C73_02095 [Candidatus Giovannonibacteria bacterium RIFCSPHIGHO2_02_FULL_44_11]OGF80610.1 MAG: hypothetical protein A2930_02915 [Candidatus Giovannonibacteria bacterium RIFCSPLOWO2_01_FULL_45_34]
MKENQKFDAGPDGRNTDKVLSEAEDKAFSTEEKGILDMYADMVERGELIEEPMLDKNGKRIGANIKEKDSPDGKPGKILYFKDDKTQKAVEAYNKKFTPSPPSPQNYEPGEN